MPGTQVELDLGGERVYAVAARTFADARPGDIMLYEDSYRNMSVAISNGNAAEMLHARAGQPIRINVGRCGLRRPAPSASSGPQGRSRSGHSVPDVLSSWSRMRRGGDASTARRLELRGAEEERLAERRADELDADREAVVRPVERQRHGRLAGDVEDGRERGEGGRSVELLARAVRLGVPADGHRWQRERRRQQQVVVGPEGRDSAGAELSRPIAPA